MTILAYNQSKWTLNLKDDDGASERVFIVFTHHQLDFETPAVHTELNMLSTANIIHRGLLCCATGGGIHHLKR